MTSDVLTENCKNEGVARMYKPLDEIIGNDNKSKIYRFEKTVESAAIETNKLLDRERKIQAVRNKIEKDFENIFAQLKVPALKAKNVDDLEDILRTEPLIEALYHSNAMEFLERNYLIECIPMENLSDALNVITEPLFDIKTYILYVFDKLRVKFYDEWNAVIKPKK